MISLRKQIKILYTIAVIVGMASIFALLYPWISNSWNQFAASQIIVDYSQQIEHNSGEKIDYSDALNNANQYNQELYLAGNNHIAEYIAKSSKTYENQLNGTIINPDEYYESCLSFNDSGMMGYITIPKINVLLPIKHYSTTEVLATSVGHIYGSSLPVGGENTHSVLTAHSALMTAKLFTDLEKMELGDIFTITVAGKNLNYQVDKIKIALPTEFEDYTIEDGKDFVTLVTCTPYAVNTHRLLVRGYRVSDDIDINTEKNTIERVQEIVAFPTTMFIVVGLILATGILIIVLIWKNKRK